MEKNFKSRIDLNTDFNMEIEFDQKFNDTRFKKIHESEIEKAKENNLKSPNTLKKQTWAVNIFNKWVKVRDVTISNEEDLCEIICKFILEARKENGESYPPQTLYQIVMCLQSHFSAIYKAKFQFLNDLKFEDIKKSFG